MENMLGKYEPVLLYQDGQGPSKYRHLIIALEAFILVRKQTNNALTQEPSSLSGDPGFPQPLVSVREPTFPCTETFFP